jgi:hypothetical protein
MRHEAVPLRVKANGGWLELSALGITLMPAFTRHCTAIEWAAIQLIEPSPFPMYVDAQWKTLIGIDRHEPYRALRELVVMTRTGFTPEPRHSIFYRACLRRMMLAKKSAAADGSCCLLISVDERWSKANPAATREALSLMTSHSTIESLWHDN